MNYIVINVKRTILFLVVFFFSHHCNAQRFLPKEVLAEFSNNLLNVKKNDQYLSAELFSIFTKKGKGDHLQIEIEIEKIGTNEENQKILFDYLYDRYTPSINDNKSHDRYSQLLDFFQNRLSMSENNAKLLAAYINRLGYLSPAEEKQRLIKKNS